VGAEEGLTGRYLLGRDCEDAFYRLLPRPHLVAAIIFLRSAELLVHHGDLILPTRDNRAAHQFVPTAATTLAVIYRSAEPSLNVAALKQRARNTDLGGSQGPAVKLRIELKSRGRENAGMTKANWSSRSPDTHYFTRRAMEEEQAAAAASSLAARGRHQEMALLYWSLANGAPSARLPIIASAVIRPGDVAL
jgi:hypothetical protein